MKSIQDISYKTLFTILFFSLAGIIFFLRIGKPAKKVSAAWWDEMWHYRKAISIENTSGSDLTDFQVAISIGTSQLITEGKMQTDCDDIRITDINGNLLPHWIQSTPGCNTDSTLVWIKTNSIPTSGNTFYIYYGNSIAASTSNNSWMPSGGNITQTNTGIIQSFIQNNNFVSKTNFNADVLVVAGGGAGGSNKSVSTSTAAGGGGAGGLIFQQNYSINSTDNFEVIIGNGGIAPNYDGNGGNGSNSIFNDLTSIGGGGGAWRNAANPGNGGSGGGVAYTSTVGGIGTSGQGYNGGSSNSAIWGGAGGGGASETGYFSTDHNGTKGGSGLYYGDIFTDNFGQNGWFAGGGGGGGVSGYSYGIGGSGGGGNGGVNANGTSGSQNTGGGGGGSSRTGWIGGNGGSGIVILKYPTTSSDPISYSYQSEETGGEAPIAYWKFDEGIGTTINDSAGTNNGIFGTGTSAPTWVDESQCISGKCLSFNGISQYLYVSDNTNFDITQNGFTYSAWIKGNSFSSTYNMFMGHHLPYFNVRSSGVLHMSMGAAGAQQSVLGSTILNTNTWYFVTATYDSQGYMKVYLNGELDGSAGPYLIPSNYGYDMYIGKWTSSNSYFFNGLIDEVKIYNYARTTDQIKQDYNSRGSLSGAAVNLGVQSNTSPNIKSSLIAYYKFDENNGTTCYDSSGNNVIGTFTGTTIPTWSSGKYNSGVNFNGVNSYIDLGNNSPIRDFTDQITVSIWAKYNTYGGGGQSYSVLAVKGSPWTFLMENPSNKIRFRVTVGGIDKNATDSQVHNLNQWYHFVGTYDGQNIKIYKNGILAGTTPATGNLNVNDVSAKIGTYTGTTYNFNGLIDEVKIYNRALTAEEIKQDYNQGSVVQFGTTNQTIGGTTTSLEYCIPGDTSYCAPPVAEWKMDEGTGTSIVDTSGNNYTSTYYGSPIKTQGKIGQAISFNGTDNGISLNGPTTYSKETISAWVYIDSSSPSGDIVGNCHTNFNTYGFSLYLDGNTLRAKAAQNAITYFYNNVTYNVSLLKNKWIHLAMSWENLGTGTGGCDATAKLYINGQMVSVGTTNFSGGYDCTKPYWYPFSMGGTTQNSLTRLTKVKLDQVRVYNYARTPAQIAHDYNRGGPIGWWKFDECQGNIAYDWSGVGNTGAINIGPSGTQNSLGTCAVGTSATWTNGASGKINNSLSFDGIDDYLQINEIGTTGNTPISLSLWAYFRSNSSGDDVFIIYGKDGTTYQCAGLYLRSSDNYVRFTGWSGSTVDYSTGFIKDYNVWHHWTLVYNGSTVLIYRDGIPDPVGSQSKSLNFTLKKLLIGGGAANGNYTDTKIDDVRIYNYALTSEQVKTVYNNGAVNFN